MSFTQYEMVREGDDYTFLYPQLGISLTFAGVRERGLSMPCRVRVEAQGSPFAPDGVLYWGRMDLASEADRAKLVTTLAEMAIMDPLAGGWRRLVMDAAVRVCADVEEGEPFVNLRQVEAPMDVAFLFEDLIPLHDVSLIFTRGGGTKSYLALALAVSVAIGRSIVPGLHVTQSMPVAYLDYEANEEEHARRLAWLCRGAGVEPPDVLYRRMTRPIADDAAKLRSELARHDVGFVVVDSLGPAADGGVESNDAIIRAINRGLRDLSTRGNPVTVLLLSHVSKAVINGTEKPSPIGGVMTTNLCRANWYLRPAETLNEDGSRTLTIEYHKANNIPEVPPRGLRITFDREAREVRFGRETLAELAAARKVTLEPREAVWTCLRRPMTARELGEASGCEPEALEAYLETLEAEGKALKLSGGRWALVSRRSA